MPSNFSKRKVFKQKFDEVGQTELIFKMKGAKQAIEYS